MSNKVTKYIFPLSLLSGIGHGTTVVATTWWLNSAGVSYSNIGLFTLASAAYGFSLFWIPFFDKIDLKYLLSKIGINFSNSIQRKGFIVISVSLAAMCIFLASFADPKTNLLSLGIPIAFAAFCMATADSVMIAYLYETLQPKDMGASTGAYRLGHYAASALALFLTQTFGIPWSLVFKYVPFIMLLLMSVIFISPKEKEHKTKGWRESFVVPYQDILKTYRFALITIILFMITYKMHDRFVAPMEQLFLFKSLGNHAYALLKLVSTFALSFSAIKSGPLIKRFGYKGGFFTSIIASVLTILCYYLCTFKNNSMYTVCLGITGLMFGGFYFLITKQKRYMLGSGIATIVVLYLANVGLIGKLEIIALFATVIIAKMTSGIRNSILYSYQMALCSKEYALTQITLMANIERLLLGNLVSVVSGFCVTKFDWSGFYLITIFMSLLPLAFISFVPALRSVKDNS